MGADRGDVGTTTTPRGGKFGRVRSARLTSSSSSSSGAGDVGDGCSVGTGISVGDEGAVGLVLRVRPVRTPPA